MELIALSQAIVTQVIVEGSTIVTSQSNGHIYIFKSINEKPIIIENERGVWALAASKKVMASGDIAGKLRVWDLETGVCIATLEGHTAAIRAIHLLDDSTLITTSKDNTLRHWDLSMRSCIRVFAGHEKGVHCSVVHGEFLVSGSHDNTARVWDINDGKCLLVLEGHRGPVYAVAFDGKSPATGSTDSTIRIWDPVSGACKAVLESHGKLVGLLVLRGELLVSGGADGVVCVWNVKELTLIHMFSAHDGVVASLAVDNSIIVSGGVDGAKIWDLADVALLKHFNVGGSIDALALCGKKVIACACMKGLRGFNKTPASSNNTIRQLTPPETKRVILSTVQLIPDITLTPHFFPGKTMALRLGTTLCGSKYSFRLVERLGDKTVFSSVFKAEVLPGIQALLPKNQWAVVKSADLENETQIDSLVKEYKYYRKPSIESSTNFRKLCDVIHVPTGWTAQKPFCLAFEWIDTTLAEVHFEKHMKDPGLVANIIKAVCGQTRRLGARYEAHITELGYAKFSVAGPEGGNARWVQPEAFRAPEVWTGVSCFHKADVWSLAAMILQRLDPNILGNTDNIDKTLIPSMAWCLAKIILLFDPSCSSIPPPSDADKTLQAYLKLAQNLTKTYAGEDSDELLLQIPPFEVWADLAADAGIPKVVLDMIRLLAIPNPRNRPSALQALQSPEYKALQEAAAAYHNQVALLRSDIR
ncbi:uncharacterized protein RSE6_09833 [Rhynchosporium secalis]|uniref:Protein kinase domain-containing protein n=1 Tax=Rhynchosporium secalis TaxID=38038 RepID=A0A1E1MIU7_RHYSE|nr:uncharacterized protein RSE6_09833 [Rhynchosporium secalis]